MTWALQGAEPVERQSCGKIVSRQVESLACLGFTLKAMGNIRGVCARWEHDEFHSFENKSSSSHGRCRFKVRKPTVFGDDLGETWNGAVGMEEKRRTQFHSHQGGLEENKRLL